MTAQAPAAHAPTHLPSGSDPLTTAAAGAILIGDAAAVGVADSFSRSDHKHSLAAPALPASQVIGAGTAGVATGPARADHVHPMTALTGNPSGYIYGLQQHLHDATSVHVEPGTCRDSTNTEDLTLAAQITYNCATAGPAANGRDQAAAFTANTMIAIYLIGGNGNAIAAIASTVFPTFGSPTLPGTYSKFRFIGSMSINAVANNVRVFQQTGTGVDRWLTYSQLPAADTACIGTQGSSAGGALAVVTTSTSWRNWVAGGTDVNFGPTRLIPPYPVGGGTPSSIFTVKGPLVRLYVTIGNDAARGFLEFAPAYGAVQAPGASPANGSGLRCYQDGDSNALSTFEMAMGEGNSFQYRSATITPDYCIQIAGFMDQL
jgi:hypothetical protein